MSSFRPFVPPQAPASNDGITPAPAFPARGASPSAKPAPGRAFVPPPLTDDEPKIDLQAMLDAAQREVDALQAKSASQSEAFQEEKSRFQSAATVLEQGRTAACRVLAKDAVALAIEIAHVLAGKAFEVDKDNLTTLMQTCLQEFSAEQPVQVRVARADAAHVQSHLESEGATSVQVVPDETLAVGDLAVEAEALVIDARLSERVAMMRDELMATVRADEVLEPEAPSEDPS